MHCQHNILKVRLLNFFFIAEIHCHFYPAVQSIEEGRDKYYTDQSSYNWTTIEKVILQVNGFLCSVLFFKIRSYFTAGDIPNHSNQSVTAGKTMCHQSVLERHQLAVFRRAPDIYQVAKNTLVAEPILLPIRKLRKAPETPGPPCSQICSSLASGWKHNSF